MTNGTFSIWRVDHPGQYTQYASNEFKVFVDESDAYAYFYMMRNLLYGEIDHRVKITENIYTMHVESK